ncbi:MAG TPA: hypothetical protein VGG28_25290 [Kofleriaceae bacterium]|jgi:hypothetical protein
MKLHAAIAAVVAAATASAEPVDKPPHGAKHVTIDFARRTLRHGDKRHYTLAWNGNTYVADNGAHVDGALIDALYAGLVPTRETQGELGCNSHTDDYPHFAITIDGNDPVELTSSSNCGDYVPWNIERGGKQLVQYGGAAWRALAPILTAVDSSWRVEPWERDGGEVLLGLYSPADGASFGDAEKCAHSLEANAQLKRFFAAPIRVEQLGIYCELATSPDCAKPKVSGMLAFGAIDVSLDLTCSQAGVAAPVQTSLDQYKAALGFVASKPVRAFAAAMGSATVRLKFDNYSWKLDSNVDGIPSLSWVPGDPTIWLYAIDHGAPNDVFWQTLGIDPKPLVTFNGSTPVTDEKIDFAGKIVR